MSGSAPAPDAARHIRNDLRERIELVSMDRYLDEITIALYRTHGGRAATVQSYSGRPGVPDRLAWLARAMAVIGGLVPAGDDGRSVGFACGGWHELAVRRTFLEACKLDPDVQPAPRPLAVDDTRFAQRVEAESLGDGTYRITSVATDPASAGRGPAVAAGLAKLAELTILDDGVTVRFACGASHDELVGLLLPRAINVRATLRELEQAATRGILVAPSAQEAAS